MTISNMKQAYTIVVYKLGIPPLLLSSLFRRLCCSFFFLLTFSRTWRRNKTNNLEGKFWKGETKSVVNDCVTSCYRWYGKRNLIDKCNNDNFHQRNEWYAVDLFWASSSIIFVALNLVTKLAPKIIFPRKVVGFWRCVACHDHVLNASNFEFFLVLFTAFVCKRKTTRKNI